MQTFISDLATFKQYGHISNQIDWDSVSAKQADAITLYFHPIFQTQLLDTLEDFSGETGNIKEDAYKIMQRAVVKGILLSYIPEGEVTIDDGGITRAESEFKKTAYAAQIQRLERQLENELYAQIDLLMDLMYSDPNQFPGFTAAPIYTSAENLLFKTAKDFAKFVTMPRAYVTYQTIFPSVQRAHVLYFNNRYDAIAMNTIFTGSSDFIKDFRFQMQSALAAFTMRDAIIRGTAIVSPDGTRIIESRNLDAATEEHKLSQSEIDRIAGNYQREGDTFLGRCDDFYQKNPGQFNITLPADDTTRANFWT